MLKTTTREPDYTSAIVILSDCQSAVLTARQPLNYQPETNTDYWTTRHSIYELKRNLRQSNISVIIDWIPGHTNLPENDEADRLSKIAANRSTTQNVPELDAPTPLSATHYHINMRTTHISNITTMSAQAKAKSLFLHTGGLLPPDNQQAYITEKVSRTFQVTIDRLTIGDHLFNNRLSHIDPTISPNCDHCHIRDGISHQLLTCSKHQQHRNILLQQLRLITPLRNITSLSLHILLGQQGIQTTKQRNFHIKSLVAFLKATNLVIPNRPTGTTLPTNPPLPP